MSPFSIHSSSTTLDPMNLVVAVEQAITILNAVSNLSSIPQSERIAAGGHRFNYQAQAELRRSEIHGTLTFYGGRTGFGRIGSGCFMIVAPPQPNVSQHAV